jgi:hypothetical protein
MSFSIVCTAPGSFELSLFVRELDLPAQSLLRRELAILLAANPGEFRVRIPYSHCVERTGSQLVEAFVDILRARGCRLGFSRGDGAAEPIGDKRHLRRLLAGPPESSVAS